MKIKVNEITNLADARYCAAMDVDFLSFSLERGNLRKLNPALIEEIAGWVSGPNLVLSFGADLDSFLEQKQKTIEESIYWLSCALSPNQLDFAEAHRPDWVQITFATLPPRETLRRWAASCRHLEITVENFSEPDLAFLFTEAPAAFLNIDHFSLGNLSPIRPLPAGVAVQSLVAQDFANLDYDRFEALMETLRTLE